MSVTAMQEGKAKTWRWRDILCAVLAGLSALPFLMNIPFALAPWGVTPSPPGFSANLHPEIHRWHFAQQGGLAAILVAGSLLALVWRPRTKPVVMQFIVVGALATLLTNLPFDRTIVLTIIPFMLTTLAYPAPRTLLDFSARGRWSHPLLGLTLLAALLMIPDAWRSLRWQIAGVGGEHATFTFWLHVVENTLWLLAAGLLASTKRPGWRVLGVLTGLTFLYFGVAALTVPTQEGSWGLWGGTLSLLGGIGYTGATLWESGRTAATPLSNSPMGNS